MNGKIDASGATIDKIQLNLLFIFFFVHPWSYVFKSSKELLAMVEKEKDIVT